jgi:hypothetical protein
MSTGFWRLTAEQQAASRAAMEPLCDVGLGFMLMVFTDDGIGTVMSNVDPRLVIGPLEVALKAAKGGVAVEDIEREPLQ